VRAGFIVVSSLGALHPGTRKYFEDVTSLKGRNMDKQAVDLCLKRLVKESLNGSFDLWINASPKAIGSFERKESIELMPKRNGELRIVQDKRKVNNDMDECLLNEITDLDKILMNTEVLEVKAEAVVELVQEKQDVIKRIRHEEVILDDNKEPKKEEIKRLKIEGAQIGEFSTDDEEVDQMTIEEAEEKKKEITVSMLIDINEKPISELDGISTKDV
jgi:DNA polymerase III delta prime subunit